MFTFETMPFHVMIGFGIVDLGRVITKTNFRDVSFSGSSFNNLIMNMNSIL